MQSEEDDWAIDVNEGSSSGEEQLMETPSSSPSSQLLSSTAATGRIFLVAHVERASGGFRPNFLFNGELVDVLPGVSGGCHRLERVLNSKQLQLSLRYEPPSPKFSRSSQGHNMVSYRLKLLDGDQFIYLQRGLPKVLVLDEQVRAVGWGQLQLVFQTNQQLSSTLRALRHVQVVHDQLWPLSIAELWGVQSGSTSTQKGAATQGEQFLGEEGGWELQPESRSGWISWLAWSSSWAHKHRTALLASAAIGSMAVTAAMYVHRRKGAHIS